MKNYQSISNITTPTSGSNLCILVLGISGNVSAGILKVVRANFKNAHIIGSCVNKTFNSIYSDEFIKSPYASDDFFPNWVKNLCKSKNINVILSGVEEVNDTLSIIKEELYSLTSTVVICPRIEALKIGKDKHKTFDWLRNNDFNFPRTILPSSKEDILSFHDLLKTNLILKPLNGKSSEGIYYVKNRNDIDGINIDYTRYALQEVIGNIEDEYTVGSFQYQNGQCVQPIVMKRELKDGHTIYAQIVQNKKISDYCLEITKKLNPLGPLNIQLRLNDFGEPVCFELNVRFSGTTLIRDFFGFKDVVAAIYEACNIITTLDLFDFKKSGICIRQVEELFFLSENISLNEKVNYRI
jgi:carbamoyl-phosphate synthase large subunit